MTTLTSPMFGDVKLLVNALMNEFERADETPDRFTHDSDDSDLSDTDDGLFLSVGQWDVVKTRPSAEDQTYICKGELCVGCHHCNHDTFESIMSMSPNEIEEELNADSSAGSASNSGKRTKHSLERRNLLRTIPHMRRVRPKNPVAREQQNVTDNELAMSMAKEIAATEATAHKEWIEQRSSSSVGALEAANAIPSHTAPSQKANSCTRNTQCQPFHDRTEQQVNKLLQNTGTVIDTLMPSPTPLRKQLDLHKPTVDNSMSTTFNVSSNTLTCCRKKMTIVSTSRGRHAHINGLDDLAAQALHRYLHQCQIKRCHPSFSHMHDILLNVNQKRKRMTEQQQAAEIFVQRTAESKAPKMKLLISNELRNMVSQLVVRLWECSQKTPFMSAAKRPTDVFRPFAAGVMFGMRRGMRLSNGVVVVPHSTSIEKTLQLSEAVRRGTGTHRIHLLAHRGMSTLQRCIGSLASELQIAEIYGPAIEVATKLQYLLSSSTSN